MVMVDCTAYWTARSRRWEFVRSTAKVAGMCLVVLFFIAATFDGCRQQEDCHRRGGVLVKDYMGFPACVGGR